MKSITLSLVSFFLILSTLSQAQDKSHYQNYLLVNFASLNLSPTDASQFTVTSYGTLKTRITPLHTCNKRSEALKSQTLLLQWY
jgi:hypothetical protein